MPSAAVVNHLFRLIRRTVLTPQIRAIFTSTTASLPDRELIMKGKSDRYHWLPSLGDRGDAKRG
jgi:hypothetical protein